MKKRDDWADRKARRYRIGIENVVSFDSDLLLGYFSFQEHLARALRAAYRKGVKEEREACLRISRLAEMFKPQRKW